jgi:hypothetical protein
LTLPSRLVPLVLSLAELLDRFRGKGLRDVRGNLAARKGKRDASYLQSWAKRMLEDRSSEELRKWMEEYGR